MVYAITYDKTKPPKHIFLPFAIKSLTWNVELIRTLDRLGHSVSYSQLEEIDTTLCLQKLSLSEGDGPLPENIHPGVFTTLVWDNIGRLEETISGEGTSHRVNGIVLQTKLVDPHPSKVLPSVDKTKKRSISTPPLMLSMYNVGQREGPPQATSVEVDTPAVVPPAKEKNVVWIMARMSEHDDQSISSWTGFIILARDDVAVVPDNVGYIPTINAPATKWLLSTRCLASH